MDAGMKGREKKGDEGKGEERRAVSRSPWELSVLVLPIWEVGSSVKASEEPVESLEQMVHILSFPTEHSYRNNLPAFPEP